MSLEFDDYLRICSSTFV